jgi:hypothetical protein
MSLKMRTDVTRSLGKYKVMTRMGMILECNSANFNDVDGILGFGWADAPRSAALLKTLTQLDRPSWNLLNQPFEGDHKPMPRKFAFTANDELGELQLGTQFNCFPGTEVPVLKYQN